jgi:hypothetical protein
MLCISRVPSVVLATLLMTGCLQSPDDRDDQRGSDGGAAASTDEPQQSVLPVAAAKKPIGSFCTSNTQCKSNICTGGPEGLKVCCKTRCNILSLCSFDGRCRLKDGETCYDFGVTGGECLNQCLGFCELGQFRCLTDSQCSIQGLGSCLLDSPSCGQQGGF